MKTSFLILVIFAAQFTTTALFAGPSDGDLTWQKWLGRTILATKKIPDHLGKESYSAIGAPWIAQEWLFSTVTAALSGNKSCIFSLTIAACAIGTLWLNYLRAQNKKSSDEAIIIMLVFGGIALLESFGIRVQVVAWAFLAATLYFLECDDKKAYFTIAVVAVWGNIHASVMIAPILTLVMALGTWLDNGRKLSDKTKKLAIISGCMMVAMCVNPFGISLPIYAVHLINSPFKEMISEWQLTTVRETSFTVGALPILLGFIIFGIRGQDAWQKRLLTITCTLLMFTAARNIAIFAIVTMPIFAETLTQSVQKLRVTPPKTDRESIKIAKAMPLIAVFLFVAMTTGLYATGEHKTNKDLINAQKYIETQNYQENIFCSDFSWCSEFIGKPNESVYLDGRADPYPQQVWDDYKTIIRLKPTWFETLNKTKTNVILTDKQSILSTALNTNTVWKLKYKNDKYVVWTRT